MTLWNSISSLSIRDTSSLVLYYSSLPIRDKSLIAREEYFIINLYENTVKVSSKSLMRKEEYL